jgi:hypothetical protein
MNWFFRGKGPKQYALIHCPDSEPSNAIEYKGYSIELGGLAVQGGGIGNSGMRWSVLTPKPFIWWKTQFDTLTEALIAIDEATKR